MRGAEHIAAAMACGLLAASYLALAACHGALGVPRNDDWTYYRAVFETARSGLLKIDTYTTTMLVGQVLAAQPIYKLFGQQLAAYQIAVATFGAVGLFATYQIIRRFLPPLGSALAAGSLALGPIYGGLSTTFMTDVPSFALQTLCLWLGLVAAERRSLAWFAAALFAALAAFSVRDFAAAAALTVAGIFALRIADRRKFVIALGLMTLWLGVAALLYWWRAGSEGAAGAARAFQLPDRSDILAVARMFFTTTLFVSPAILALRPERLIQSWKAHKLSAFATLAAILSLALAIHSTGPVFLGNYFTPFGSYPETLPGEAARVLPEIVWRGIELVGVVAAGVLAVVVAGARPIVWLRQKTDGLRENDRAALGAMLALTFGVATLLLTTAASLLTGAPVFDRYIVPAVPFLAAVVLYCADPIRGGWFAAAVGLVAWMALGLVVMDASAAFDGAKWRASYLVATAGYHPDEIDGGLEWFGFHQPGAIVPLRRVAPGENFWRGLFDHQRVCVTLRSGWSGGRDTRPIMVGRSLTANYVISRHLEPGCHETPMTDRARSASREDVRWTSPTNSPI